MGWQPDETVRITLYFRDYKGVTTLHIINVAASLLPIAGAFAASYAELFVPISSCALWKVTVALRFLDDTDPAPATNSDVNRCSVFQFATADGGRFDLTLPGLVAAKLLQPPDPYAGVGLDITDVDIAALVAATVTGIGGTEPCAPWGPGVAGALTWQGSDLVGLLTAYWGYERAERRY